MVFFITGKNKKSKKIIKNEDIIYSLNDIDISLRLRYNPRAKRISLKLNHDGNGIILSMPSKSQRANSLNFLNQQSGWIFKNLNKSPASIIFEYGAVIPYDGQQFKILYDESKKFDIEFTDGKILIAAPKEHLSRRLSDFIKKQAKVKITNIAKVKISLLNQKLSCDKKLGRITIKDQRSLWASCSSKGNLSFSWRLMFAPEHVLKYVIAHEVAHLIEMNHSSDFWHIVDMIVENYHQSRQWLKKNGTYLHKISPRSNNKVK